MGTSTTGRAWSRAAFSRSEREVRLHAPASAAFVGLKSDQFLILRRRTCPMSTADKRDRSTVILWIEAGRDG
jgi:hypothetical protein